LRRLRQFAREAPSWNSISRHDPLDRAQCGWLDLKMVPERHKRGEAAAVFDIGIDGRPCAGLRELFSAARGEFKHLEYFYFHNCLYDTVWKDSRRRHVEQIDVMQILRTTMPVIRSCWSAMPA